MGRGPARSGSPPPSGHCKPPEWVPPVVLLGRKWALSSVLGTRRMLSARSWWAGWHSAVKLEQTRPGERVAKPRSVLEGKGGSAWCSAFSHLWNMVSTSSTCISSGTRTLLKNSGSCYPFLSCPVGWNSHGSRPKQIKMLTFCSWLLFCLSCISF